MSLAATLGVLILASLVIIQSSAYIPPTRSCRKLTIPKKRQELSIAGASELANVLSTLRRGWDNHKSNPRITKIKFAPHKICPHCRGKREVLHNDVEVEGRAKRSVTPFRKDYRQMKKGEMNTFHAALQLLKAAGTYDDLVLLHRKSEAPAAHFGMAFLPWHREYLFQLEEAARRLGKRFKKLTVPFWDSCLDESLPEPKDCIVWTKPFWGKGNGQVNNGRVARNWDVTSDVECQDIDSKVTRDVSGAKGSLLTRQKITNNLLPSTTFFEFGRESPLEGYHGEMHDYVGGHAGNLVCSPNDPVFFFLHAMFDCLWEEWAALPGKDNTYPFPWNPSQGDIEHGRDQPMSPFEPLTNGDGMWTGYTGCHERPSKIVCSTDAECKSPQGLLFCDNCRCHCKIRKKGNCSGLPHNACYCKKGTPECDSGKCKCI